MRLRIAALASALLVVFAALAASGLARSRTRHYTGRAGAGDAYAMSFSVSRGRVVGFTFVSRCPGLRNGTTVPARIRIVGGRFHYRDEQFTISGRFLRGGMARGTERDRTGDCDSGTLDWAARLAISPRFTG